MATYYSVKDHQLDPKLRAIAFNVFEMAKGYGLTHYPVKFVTVTPSELNGIAAYGGFPARMGHWSFGMSFEDLHKRYSYGASKIYELVINTDPVIAYLLNTNTVMDQKLVMIHVCGHADFFYNNRWFSKTNRTMLDQMANNASRVRRIMDLKGEQVVEDFLDVCLSIDNLVDPYKDHIKRQRDRSGEDDIEPSRREVPKLRANKDYMERYINTEEFIQRQKEKIAAEKQREKNFPEYPERDILGFLIDHAPLERWQRDILAMVREEAYYFAPQRMTKIMNEGWATYIHSKFMTEKLLEDSEVVDYCDAQSRVIAMPPGSLNPYRIGFTLFKDIEDRWNKGKHGFEWESCDNIERKRGWDLNHGKGKDKIFQVRQTHNDLTFIDEFLTPDFCVEHELFSFKKNMFGYDEVTREFKTIKQHLLSQLANGGSPVIQIENANHGNRGELFLQHVFNGQPLDKPMGRDTLRNLYRIWNRPVHLETEDETEDGVTHKIRWSFDGQNFLEELVA